MPIDPHLPSEAAPPALPQFKRVQVDRAADHIARQIREEISQGRLKPGAKLPAERALAAELGVSRNTLREAVRSLEQAGLVHLRKGAHGGIFVREDNSGFVASGLLDLYRLGGITPRQLIQAHLWIVPVLVREACRLATPEDIAELNRNIDAAEWALENGEFEKKFLLNHEFHRKLARMTGNPVMDVLVDGMMQVLVEFIVRIGPQDNAYILTSRRRFMAQFARGNAQAAARELSTSLQSFLDNYFPPI
jgi:GntR family transcriptional repressor for pyruvate dehydrogenase complex